MFFGFDSDLHLKNGVTQVVLAAIEELGLQDYAVMTTVPGCCVTCNRELTQSPFLRICSTDATQIDDIVNALRDRDVLVDCETLLLTDFVARDEMGHDAGADRRDTR